MGAAVFLLPLLFLLKKDCNFTQFFFVGKRPCNLIGTGTFGSFLLNMMKNELLFFFFCKITVEFTNFI